MIFKNSLVLAFFSAGSLLLAVVRDRLLATSVGVGPVLDLYNASFRIPDLLYGALLAFISAGTVVPFLTKEDKNGKQISPLHRLTSLMSLFLTVNILLAVLFVILLPYVAHYIVPGFNEAQVQEYIFLTRLLLIQPIFLGLASLFSCYAQLRNEFIIYGISPLLYSLGIIFGIIHLYPAYGVEGLIYGVIIGAVLSFVLQSFSLRSLRLHHLKHIFSWHLTKEAIHLALPRTGTNLITQTRVILFHGFATTLGPGYLSAYLFALRITEAISQIFQQSLTTASIPVLSRNFTENNISTYKKIVKKYVLILGGLGIILATLVFFWKTPIIEFLYGNGDKNYLIQYFLIGALLALPFQMVAGYFSIGLYSIHDTKSVMIAYLVSSTLAVGIMYYLKESHAFALLFANTFFWVILSLILFVLYSRKRL